MIILIQSKLLIILINISNYQKKSTLNSFSKDIIEVKI